MPRKAPSSQCIWSGSVSPQTLSKVLGSLDPVKSVNIITPDAVELPALPRNSILSRTLKQIVELGPAPTALSRPRNDNSDSILVLDGKAWLSLSPESFASFGLDAKKFGSRYLAVYDLRKPGKRLDRFMWALDNTITGTYEFVVLGPEFKGTSESKAVDIIVPPLNPSDLDEGFQDWSNAFIEWSGLVFLSPALLATDNGGVDPAICDYRQFEGQHETVCAAAVTQAIRAQDVEKIWRSVALQSWSVVHVRGFELAPIAWSPDRPHTGKEVGYTIIKNNDTVSVFKFL